ncbi:4-hydroxy-2-oxo-heptane-1,7-dioate aldolase [Bosea sp. SSUT16]|uniref:4-hydroxy-2-oxo-heptane-1,7-dioate aldolase n=1 Tax=Bosea spartocytisi TaxID=2773451 RepID=A0A927HZ23_9HYPH|nr:aldolase/citrate lyase family protein [Bosea spartocytisi]MBD3845021.1 4-hydroxy-2-oxo-heptane-1,7-dioate aldolase [Bosea spartocytisi]MCT4471223.1 aldolase/citrate lyase family protein [Bosea spartocytisi]
MKLPSNRFLASIRSGRPQIGLWLSLASGYATEAVAGADFDWLLIDTEHSPNDLSSVLTQLQVLAAHPVTPIVRPDWNDPVLVKRLLDIGAPGLLFPMVQSPEEAGRAVAATRYPPHGIRGVSGCTRANGFARMSDYFSRIEEETAVLVQVETRAAIAQVLEIGRVEGVDGVFFGPADIAADIGLLGKPSDPAVWDVIRPAARKLIEAGIPVGTLVFDPAFARSLVAEGFSFVACGSDAVLLARGADSLSRTMRG